MFIVNLSFTGKRRREEANFPGASIIVKQIKEKPQKRRVGFISSGAPARGRISTFSVALWIFVQTWTLLYENMTRLWKECNTDFQQYNV